MSHSNVRVLTPREVLVVTSIFCEGRALTADDVARFAAVPSSEVAKLRRTMAEMTPDVLSVAEGDAGRFSRGAAYEIAPGALSLAATLAVERGLATRHPTGAAQRQGKVLSRPR